MALQSKRFAQNRRLRRAAENNPAIRRGEANHDAVAVLQRALVLVGYPMPLSTRPDGSMDGIFGPETAYVVEHYQEQHGLLGRNGKPDGIVGHDTLHDLDQRVRLIRGHSRPKPPLVRQNLLTCWAAAIESMTNHRHRVQELTRKYGGPFGKLSFPGGFDLVGKNLRINFAAERAVEAHIPALSNTFLFMLEAQDRYVFYSYRVASTVQPDGTIVRGRDIGHSIVIYGIDGIGSSSLLVSYMDPINGYRTETMKELFKRGHDIIVGRER